VAAKTCLPSLASERIAYSTRRPFADDVSRPALAAFHVAPPSELTKTPLCGVPAKSVAGAEGNSSKALTPPPAGPIVFHIAVPWARQGVVSKSDDAIDHAHAARRRGAKRRGEGRSRRIIGEGSERRRLDFGGNRDPPQGAATARLNRFVTQHRSDELCMGIIPTSVGKSPFDSTLQRKNISSPLRGHRRRRELASRKIDE
jgi:hypothetical protein